MAGMSTSMPLSTRAFVVLPGFVGMTGRSRIAGPVLCATRH